MNASDTSHTASAADDANGPGDNRHYLRALTDMADRGSVLTHDAIYTDRGIKLVDKGARVDSQLYDRLVKHKLRGNIEDHLSVENMVSVQSVLQVARAQCESDTLAYLLVHTLNDMTESKLLAPVRAMPLPPALAFKLTVMREQHPLLFAHSVRMMLVAVYLGIKSGLSERECTPLAAAALLHDLGVLHMDPVWHDPANKIRGWGASSCWRTRSRPCSSSRAKHLSALGGAGGAGAPRMHGRQRLPAAPARRADLAPGADPADRRGGGRLL